MVCVNASDARNDFSDVLDRVAYQGERVVLHRRGKDVAVIISLKDLAFLEKYEDEQDLRDAKAALKEAAKKGGKPLSRVMEELGSKI